MVTLARKYLFCTEGQKKREVGLGSVGLHTDSKRADSKYSCHAHCFPVSRWHHNIEDTHNKVGIHRNLVQSLKLHSNLCFCIIIVHIKPCPAFCSTNTSMSVAGTECTPGVNHYRTTCFTFNVRSRQKLPQTVSGIQFPSFLSSYYTLCSFRPPSSTVFCNRIILSSLAQIS
jgi:hypothetical protein